VRIRKNSSELAAGSRGHAFWHARQGRRHALRQKGVAAFDRQARYRPPSRIFAVTAMPAGTAADGRKRSGSALQCAEFAPRPCRRSWAGAAEFKIDSSAATDWLPQAAFSAIHPGSLAEQLRSPLACCRCTAPVGGLSAFLSRRHLRGSTEPVTLTNSDTHPSNPPVRVSTSRSTVVRNGLPWAQEIAGSCENGA